LEAAWFQSVTARTAGFNTVDLSQATEPTLLLTIVLMVIGGSPGSAAGGVKTTTFVVIVLVVLTRLRGHRRIEVRKRSIPDAVVTKALVVMLLGIALIVVATGVLLITDGPTLRRAATEAANSGEPWKHGTFITLLFEVVSAFGTVGLSVLDTAVTGALTWGGKLVIICVMYLGRLGPLALAQLVLAADKPQRFKYPEEYLLVG
jgi:trk system potassium uptake protein TrkH